MQRRVRPAFRPALDRVPRRAQARRRRKFHPLRNLERVRRLVAQRRREPVRVPARPPRVARERDRAPRLVIMTGERKHRRLRERALRPPRVKARRKRAVLDFRAPDFLLGILVPERRACRPTGRERALHAHVRAVHAARPRRAFPRRIHVRPAADVLRPRRELRFRAEARTRSRRVHHAAQTVPRAVDLRRNHRRRVARAERVERRERLVRIRQRVQRHAVARSRSRARRRYRNRALRRRRLKRENPGGERVHAEPERNRPAVRAQREIRQ